MTTIYLTAIGTPLRYQYITGHADSQRICTDLLCDVHSSLNLEQHYPIHQTKGYNLDLLFAPDNTVSLLDIQEELLPTGCHHSFGFFKINAERAVNCAPSFVKRKFFKANYDFIVNHHKNINRDLTLSNDNLDDNITSFNEVINNLIGNNVPTSYVDPNSYPKWYDYDLIRAIRDKKRTHSMWKATRDPSFLLSSKDLGPSVLECLG